MLLFMLLGSLEAGFVSHYFIPEINLLERVSEDVRSNCIRIITILQKDILLAAPFAMPENCFICLDYIYNILLLEAEDS